MLPRHVFPGIAAASAAVLLTYAIMHATNDTHGFSAYYTESRLLVDGGDYAGSYNVDTFNVHLRSYGMNAHEANVNLPTNALPLVPLASFDWRTARAVWTGCSVAMYVLAVLMLLNIFNLRWNTRLGMMAVTLAFVWQPMYDNLAHGQLYALLMMLFVVSLDGLRRGGAWKTGVPLGIALCVKGYGIVPVCWLLVHRRWREAGIAIATAAAIVAGSLPWIGGAAWNMYAGTILPVLGRMPGDGHVANQTVNGIAHHLLVFDATYHRLPMMALSESTAYTVGWMANVAIIGAVVLGMRRSHVSPAFSYATVIAVGVVTAPLAGDAHYLLFLPLVVALLGILAERQSVRKIGRFGITIIAALLLMALSMRYAVLHDASVPWVFAAYPKLFAGLVLLGCALIWSRRPIDPQRNGIWAA